MNKIKDVITVLEQYFPLEYQEEWDNSGLQVGDIETEVTGVLCAIDLTENIVQQAIKQGCNLIVTHHPPLFRAIKKLDNSNYINRSIILAIKHNISIYSAHTSADNSPYGLNYHIAKSLNLKNIKILKHKNDGLIELSTFVPDKYANNLYQELTKAGAGRLGNYDSCAFTSHGVGRFRPLKGARSFVGTENVIHEEAEVEIKMILKKKQKQKILSALINNHPYETPSYNFKEIYSYGENYGTGIIGDLSKNQKTIDTLNTIKNTLQLACLQYSEINRQTISKIAICSGAGAFLHKEATHSGADILICGEAKYNDYFDAKDGAILVTTGHYESEIISQEIFKSIIMDNFTNFVTHISEQNINPVNYL